MVMGVILSLVLERLLLRPRRWHYPLAIYLTGLGFVLAG
jgi:hypothetical protein